ncbi:unnamed protein product [Calypogeia fissa]
MKPTFSSKLRFFFFSASIAIGILSLSPAVTGHSHSHSVKAVTELWQFPNNTWVENLAVRSNGKLLVTLLTAPEVWQVDPLKDEEPFLVARFPNAIGALGIAELEKDVFVVATGNLSVKEARLLNANSTAVWTVDVRDMDPQMVGSSKGVKVSKITNIPDALVLNGLVTLDAKRGLVLVADSQNGWIYLVNALTGEYKVVLDDITLKPTNVFPLGVNGIRLRDGVVYYTSSAQGQFGKVKINSTDGTAMGPYFLIAGNGFADDFDLDPSPNGMAYSCTNPFNDLKTIAMDGAVNTILGGVESTLIAGDTSARFGREKNQRTLYVTTNGGLARPVNGRIEGGKVMAVELTELGH